MKGDQSSLIERKLRSALYTQAETIEATDAEQQRIVEQLMQSDHSEGVLLRNGQGFLQTFLHRLRNLWHGETVLSLRAVVGGTTCTVLIAISLTWWVAAHVELPAEAPERSTVAETEMPMVAMERVDPYANYGWGREEL